MLPERSLAPRLAVSLDLAMTTALSKVRLGFSMELILELFVSASTHQVILQHVIQYILHKTCSVELSSGAEQ